MNINRKIPIKLYLIGIFCLFSASMVYSQSPAADSLKVAKRIAFADSLFRIYLLNDAIKEYQDIIDTNDEVSDGQLSKIYNNLGDGYFELKIYDKALNNYLINLADHHESDLTRAGIEYRLGRLYATLHDYSSALRYFRSSRAVFKAKDNPYWRTIDMALGNALFESEKYDSAINYYSEVQAFLYSKKDTTMNLADLYNNWGFCYSKMGMIQKSDSLYLIALSFYEKLGNLSKLAGLYHNRGLNRLREGNFKSAKIDFEKSLQYSGNDYLGNYRKALYGLGKVYTFLGNYKLGSEYLLEYDSLRNIYLNQEKNNTIARLEVVHKVSEYQRDILLREAELSRERVGKNYVIAAMVLILVGFFVYLYISEQRKKSMRIVATKNQQLANQKINDLLQQQEIHSLQGVLAGQETERKRIAGDLHDKLGAILSMVKLHFSAVEDRLDNLKEENKEQYNKANALLDEAAGEVRNISHNLISGVLTKFGLVPALKDLKETIESTGKLQVQLVVSDMSERLNGDQELQIYRIIQELVGNILKHAKGTEATIQLNRLNGSLNLIVEDNGVGFDVESTKEKEGMGLTNLEARVHKLGGSLHFDSGKGAGTTVSIDMPIEHD